MGLKSLIIWLLFTRGVTCCFIDHVSPHLSYIRCGDLMIGSLINIHQQTNLLRCSGALSRGYDVIARDVDLHRVYRGVLVQHVEALSYYVSRLNLSKDFLPNITLGKAAQKRIG